MKYNCTVCGAGCYSADTTKTICAECERDNNLIEVVRCKDCQYKDTKFCPASQTLIKWFENQIDDFVEETFSRMEFCSYGERRAK